MDPHLIVDAIRWFVALITVAAVAAMVVRRLAVPYSVALVVLGLMAGLVIPSSEFSVAPEIVLLVLVPGLVFDAALRLHVDELRRFWGPVALLAVPGVIATAAVVAIVLRLATGLDPRLGFVVGAIVAATDPVAVIATFRSLRAPRGLATLVEGESLFNDGTALVVFSIAVRSARTDVGATEAIVSMLVTVGVSIGMGVIAGLVASRLIARLDDHVIELSLSLAAAYGTYLAADAFHQSGIIATVVAGIVIGNYGRSIGMSTKTEEALDIVWEFLAFLLTALAFLLVGLATPLPSVLAALPSIAWGVVAVVVARLLVVYLLLGGASRLAPGTRAASRSRRATAAGTGSGGASTDAGPISLPWLHVMFWAGLRGAVAVAMALSLPGDFPERHLLQAITFGVVLFTLFVQGGTAERVVAWAGVGKQGEEPRAVSAIAVDRG